MKLLLLPFLAAFALPNAVNAGYSSNVDLMTDETKLRAYLDSSTTTANSIGIQEEATIWIRCSLKDNLIKSFDAYIDTPSYNADNNNVALRWNKGEPAKARWSKSVDSSAFFAPKPKVFANQISNSDSLVFQWTPYNSGSRAVKFDLGDFKQDINKLIEAGCDFQ